MSNNNGSNGLGLIACVLIIVSGFYALWMVLGVWYKEQYSGKYLETQAVVTMIDTEHTGSDGTRKNYGRRIATEYYLNGKKYERHRPVLDDSRENHIHEGMELTILYNYNDPYDDLIPGDKDSTVEMIFIVSGVVIFGVTIFMIIMKRGEQ